MGPLVVCCAVCKRDNEKLLRDAGPRDSKKLSPAQRESIYQELKKICTFKWIELSADDLNSLMGENSLNDIEAKIMADLIKGSEASDVMIDMPDRYSWTFRNRMEKFGVRKFEAEHKADDRYPIVAAASICAKIVRDRKIREIAEATCEFGSGYPSDAKTITALKDREKMKILIPFIRKKWKTLENIKQTRLFDGEDIDTSENPE